jgi:hypothetical protein
MSERPASGPQLHLREFLEKPIMNIGIFEFLFSGWRWP